ncbi:hypothetical protein V1290_000354 [Bradyrhizobium sp. AZCC 1578]|uniref:hypothetical protein n=1 Tax=Bradyrhizobium sp. AZCC 1578 TaxID=3117027 RepID=UPI002FF2A7FC
MAIAAASRAAPSIAISEKRIIEAPAIATGRKIAAHQASRWRACAPLVAPAITRNPA